MKIKVVYSPKVVSDSHAVSPSAIKPKLLAEYLETSEYKDIIEFVEPIALDASDFKRCHQTKFVEDILTLKRPNGFGTYSQSVVDSLPYTNGAMYTSTKIALEEKIPTVAAVAGFHHSGYDRWEGLGYFCTFNGLMIAATKLVEEGKCNKVCIVDCDMHWGNGTDDIIRVINPNQSKYLNISFGKYFGIHSKSKHYLEYFDTVRFRLENYQPDVIIYQSGGDVHIDDPMGGLLTEEEMYIRDIKMFTIAKELNIPITWTLAGGYQRDADGGCSNVIKLHANTFKACKEVYGE